jgi:hypothetical protein
VSPANAAVRNLSSAGTAARSAYSQNQGSWPTGLALIMAAALLVITWGVSSLIAARRSG